jgi:phosphoribulokinase
VSDTDRVLALIGRIERRPVIVGIDGRSGAGKSTLARALAAASPLSARVVEGDDFYLGTGLGFDWQRLERQVLEPARRGDATLRYQRYAWDEQRLGDWTSLTGANCLVVEGIYMFRRELRERFDLKIWVDAEEVVRLERIRARHATYSPELRDRQNASIERWLADEDQYICNHQPQAFADLTLWTGR